MSRESRKEKQKSKQVQRFKFFGLAVFAIALIVLISYVLQKQKILEQTIWTKDVKTTVYFFKSIEDVKIDGLTGDYLTVEPGTKLNGYSPLTTEEMVVNTSWAEKQQKVIQTLMDCKAYDNWKEVINASLKAKTENVAIDDSSLSLHEMAPYVGMTAEQLSAKLEVMKQLGDGQPRAITLQGLNLQGSGNVYATTTSRKQALNERYLPYLDTQLINRLKNCEKQNYQALTVVGNEHVFAVAIIDEKLEISGEKQMAALKTQNMADTNCTDLTYYQMLGNRIDLARQYPSINMDVGDTRIEAKLVNIQTEGKNKIVYLMITSNLSSIIDTDCENVNLEIQRIRSFVVPRSAVEKLEDGKGTLTIMERTYFPEKVQVNVNVEDGNDLILSVEDNPELSEGDSYKVHP